jgi:hypothetical protein
VSTDDPKGERGDNDRDKERKGELISHKAYVDSRILRWTKSQARRYNDDEIFSLNDLAYLKA